MRILVISQWFPPEPANLMLELSRTLQEFGHDVDVLTGFPNYPHGSLYDGYKLRPWQRETIEGIPVTRVYLYPDHSSSGLRRAANSASFALSSAAFAPFLLKRPDVIYAKHPPLTIGLPAVSLSKLWRIPMIYRVVDMWPETLRATGMVSSDRTYDRINDLGRFIYRNSSEISVISPGFRANLIEKGVPPQKIQVISDWVDSELYHPAERDPAQAEELGLAGKFNVMFAGNIGVAQGLDSVLEAAVLTQDIKNLQYVLVGDGVELQRLKDVAREREIHKVRFLGRFPVEAMSGLYAHADVLLVHLKDDPLFRITIPHKIYAYLASAKPILVAVRGDASDVVVGAGAGLACDPENPQALAAAVREIVAMPQEQRDKMAAAGLYAARECYSRPQSVRKIEQRMIELTKAR